MLYVQECNVQELLLSKVQNTSWPPWNSISPCFKDAFQSLRISNQELFKLPVLCLSFTKRPLFNAQLIYPDFVVIIRRRGRVRNVHLLYKIPSGIEQNACLICTRPWVESPVLLKGEIAVKVPHTLFIHITVFLCGPKVNFQVFFVTPSPTAWCCAVKSGLTWSSELK